MKEQANQKAQKVVLPLKRRPYLAGLWGGFMILLGAMSCSTSNPSGVTDQHYRPAYHFTPPSNWMNDPNGLVYHQRKYHLFYQHYPDDIHWGPMHWGHAVSKDLFHWKHQPIALYPDEHGWIFSGSAVSDLSNTSKLSPDRRIPLVAIFTHHDAVREQANRVDVQNQSLAYSLDRGKTWQKYAKNPVLVNPGHRDFRDPKVFWHDPIKKWVMLLAVKDHISFYTSPNLIDWTQAGDFGKGHGEQRGIWECPDLFPLKDPISGKEKWVLLVSVNAYGPNRGSATQYFIGSFDGTTFSNANPPDTTLWLDYGPDHYAAVSWSGIPSKDGRCISIGWMSNWLYAQDLPTTTWRNAMSIPRVLSLGNTSMGLRLFSYPVEELMRLRRRFFTIPAQIIRKDIVLPVKLGLMPTQTEIMAEFVMDEQSKGQFGIELYNENGERYEVGYDSAKKCFFSNRQFARDSLFSEEFTGQTHLAPRFFSNKTVKMHLLIDHCSAELFADEGATVMSSLFFPLRNFSQMKFFAKQGAVLVKTAAIYVLGDGKKKKA